MSKEKKTSIEQRNHALKLMQSCDHFLLIGMKDRAPNDGRDIQTVTDADPVVLGAGVATFLIRNPEISQHVETFLGVYYANNCEGIEDAPDGD